MQLEKILKFQKFLKIKNYLKLLIKSNYLSYKIAVTIKLLLSFQFRRFLIELKIILNSYQDFFVKKNELKKINRLYIKSIKICVKKNVHNWWHYTDVSLLYSLPSLYGFVKECVLRRAGDYEQTLKILHELKNCGFQFSLQEKFLYEMTKYFSEITKKIDNGYYKLKNKSEKQILMMGCSVWGEGFCKIFLNFCLPSLLTDGNLGVLLKKRKLVIFIQTDKPSRNKIINSNIIKFMKSKGVTFLFMYTNVELTKYFISYPESKYWHLGLVQSIDIYLAKSLNADYHVLMPDSVYSENHFKGIFSATKKNHKIITRLMVTTKLENVCADIEKYRSENNGLSIPAADLNAISIKHIHPYAKNWLQTNNDILSELPHVHVIMWESYDSIIMKSSHQTIIFYDANLLKKITSRYVFSLDSELDKIIEHKQPIYCPQIADEIGLIEMTSSSSRSEDLPRKNINDFSDTFWFSAQGSMKYWKFFEKESKDRLNRNLLKNRRYLSQKKINSQIKFVSDKLIENFPVDEKLDIKEKLLKLI